jgi:hypothetical protein
MMHPNFVGDLIDEGLKMFLYPKKELTDPFDL